MPCRSGPPSNPVPESLCLGRIQVPGTRRLLTSACQRTTVIVLGDARNNYNLPNEWTLRDIRLRAKQLIWLNPESKMTWGFGDSEMERYRPYCDVVEECRNLNQLYHVIDRLVVS